MFTETEAVLIATARRSINAVTDQAQAIVDQSSADIDALMAEVVRLRDEVKTERARRILAEARVEKLLNTPI